MDAHVKTLPNSCLLILRTEGSGHSPLSEALQCVLSSSQRSVWVDCRHVAALPAEALLLLRQCAKRLWQHGGHLVLCHLPDATRAALAADATQPLAASILDAAQYGLDCPEIPAA